MFIAALFTIDKIRKQAKYPSVDEWIKKIWCIYTRNRILASDKNSTIFSGGWVV